MILLLKTERRRQSGDMRASGVHGRLAGGLEAARAVLMTVSSCDPLTERELEIVRLVASGYKNKEVGATLAISERTVKTHLTNIFQKLGVRDRVGLVMYALRHNLTAAA